MIKSGTTRNTRAGAFDSTRTLSSYYQLLHHGEVTDTFPVFANGDTLTVWINGLSTRGKISRKKWQRYDGNGEFTLSLETPVPVTKNSKTFFVDGKRLVGIGTIK